MYVKCTGLVELIAHYFHYKSVKFLLTKYLNRGITVLCSVWNVKIRYFAYAWFNQRNWFFAFCIEELDIERMEDIANIENLQTWKSFTCALFANSTKSYYEKYGMYLFCTRKIVTLNFYQFMHFVWCLFWAKIEICSLSQSA